MTTRKAAQQRRERRVRKGAMKAAHQARKPDAGDVIEHLLKVIEGNAVMLVEYRETLEVLTSINENLGDRLSAMEGRLSALEALMPGRREPPSFRLPKVSRYAALDDAILQAIKVGNNRFVDLMELPEVINHIDGRHPHNLVDSRLRKLRQDGKVASSATGWRLVGKKARR